MLALSNSGETRRAADASCRVIKRLDVPLIALTGNAGSTLARYATVHARRQRARGGLPAEPRADRQHHGHARDGRRAGGRAARGARLHRARISRARTRAAALGRRLLLHVEDVMRTRRRPAARSAPTRRSAPGLLEMSRKGLGMTTVVDDARRVLGVFTDGDLRRALDRQLDVHAHAHARRHDARSPQDRRGRACSRPRPCT